MSANPTPDFSALTDAELDKHLARLDGYKLGNFYGDDYCYKDSGERLPERIPKYTTSLDAAVALADRWGIEWQRVNSVEAIYVEAWPYRDRSKAVQVDEIMDMEISRALSEALATAKTREDAK